MDLVTRYDHRALLKALAEAEFHHDTRPDDILRTLRRGHPGSANLRAALKAHAPGQARSHQSDSNDDRDLWLRRNHYIARRYGTKQIHTSPDHVIADLQDGFTQAQALGHAKLLARCSS
jgi:hypothetical protein